jgi:alanyl-tRNA synthetase
VIFVCGRRALRSYRHRRDVSDAAARLLSSSLDDLPATIERLQGDLKSAGKAIKRLEEDLSRFRAAELVAAAETIGAHRVVLTHQPEADASGLKRLASEIVRATGHVVILTGGGQPTPVVAARSADGTFDAGAWLKAATAALGGRGGGRPEQAQGGIPAPSQEILNFARASLASS